MARRAVIAVVGGLLAVRGVTGQEAPLIPTTWNGIKYGCRCYPGDDCWPSRNDWNDLNKTVDGNLAVIVPPGAVCHETFRGYLGTSRTYDAAKCAEVTANFGNEQWQYVLAESRANSTMLMPLESGNRPQSSGHTSQTRPAGPRPTPGNPVPRASMESTSSRQRHTLTSRTGLTLLGIITCA